jgi:hypothetical protein
MRIDNYACGGFFFYSNFDSGNLAKVELVKVNEGKILFIFFLHSKNSHFLIVFCFTFLFSHFTVDWVEKVLFSKSQL